MGQGVHFQVSFSDAALTEPRTLKPVRAGEQLSHRPLLSWAQAGALRVGFAWKDKLSCSSQSLASSWSLMGPLQPLSEKNFGHEASPLDDQAITFSWWKNIPESLRGSPFWGSWNYPSVHNSEEPPVSTAADKFRGKALRGSVSCTDSSCLCLCPHPPRCHLLCLLQIFKAKMKSFKFFSCPIFPSSCSSSDGMLSRHPTAAIQGPPPGTLPVLWGRPSFAQSAPQVTSSEKACGRWILWVPESLEMPLHSPPCLTCFPRAPAFQLLKVYFYFSSADGCPPVVLIGGGLYVLRVYIFYFSEISGERGREWLWLTYNS